MTQIKIQDLLPLLKPGRVAMDENGYWWWFEPASNGSIFDMMLFQSVCLSLAIDIAPYDGDWKDSLTECGK